MTINRRKISFLALGAVLWGLVGITMPAHAVFVSQTGLGEVLIFPYYTVRGGTDTYISVVNTMNVGKAVKVRFTEGLNSREVLDFNLYLSPYDVWTGAVVATADGAKLITRDNSCTSPPIPKPGGVDFVPWAYTLNSLGGTAITPGIVNSGNDGADQTLDRTREGYIEIIEMGVMDVTTTAAVTHLSTGVPVNCALVQAITTTMNAAGSNPVTPTTGGLGGTVTLINVAQGTDFSVDPLVLSAFNNIDNLWFPPGDIRPDMQNARPTSTVFTSTGASTNTWDPPGFPLDNGEDAVSSIMMHNNIINEYVLDAGTLSGTDWVVTMPTKRYYVPVFGNVEVPRAPFTAEFTALGACESIAVSFWNREEQTPATPPSGVNFSPPQPGAPAPGTFLCYETNIITFNNSAVLAASATNSVNIDVGAYENGWMNVNFNGVGQILTATGGAMQTFVGLPTMGFMVQDFVNGDVGGLLSNYGGNFDHKYTVSITP